MTDELKDRAERAAASMLAEVEATLDVVDAGVSNLVRGAFTLGWLAGHEAGRIDGIGYATDSFAAVLEAHA